jgi:hypothetical protein
MLDCGWYATLVGEEHTFVKELSWIDCVVPWHRSPAAVDKDLAISQELKVGRFVLKINDNGAVVPCPFARLFHVSPCGKVSVPQGTPWGYHFERSRGL